MATSKRAMTADEFMMLRDDGFSHELVRGELRRYPFSGFFHGIVGSRIICSIGLQLRARDLGGQTVAKVGFQLANDHVRAPDVSYIVQERIDALVGNSYYFPGPPDLAIEILESGDRPEDVAEKILDLLEAGCIAVITADTRTHSVHIHRSSTDVVTLTESDVLEIPELIPGWSMPVADIFSLD